MKNTNSIIIATIIATFVFTIFAFQPTTTEASNDVSPEATPSPRPKRPKTIQSPRPIQSPKPSSSRARTRRPASGLTYQKIETVKKPQNRKGTKGKRQHKP